MKKFLSTVLLLAAIGYFVWLLIELVVTDMWLIRTGHGSAVLIRWTLTIGGLGLSEVLYFWYVKYAPSAFSDRYRIDQVPPRPKKIEKTVRQSVTLLQGFVAVALFATSMDGFFRDLAGAHDGWTTAAIWVVSFTALLTWAVIVDLYTRYATSIFSERNVTPVPFAKR